MNREAIDNWVERGILGCVLVILIVGPLAFGAVDPLPFLTIQGFCVVVMLLWVVRLWVNPKPRFLWPPISWLIVAFAIYAVWRYLQADIEYVARQELIRVVIYSFLFLAILNNLHSQETVRIITVTLILLATAISCYGIYQFLANSDRVWHLEKPYSHRGSGTFISPNHLGGFLEMILPLALAYTIAGRVKPVVRIFAGYAVLILIAGIVMTVSRGSWMATGLALAVFFTLLLFHRTHRIPAVVCLILIVGGGIYFFPKSEFLKARSRIVLNGRLDDDKRFALWRPALELWRENVWWGVGPGHFDYRFRQVRPEDVQRQPDRVHNDFLNTLVDWGVVGAVLVAAALGSVAWGVVKTWRFVKGAPSDLGEAKRNNKFAVLLGVSMGLLAIFFHSTVDFNMHIPANAILAITLMAVASSHLRFATESFWFTARPWSKVLLSIVLVTGLVYLTTQAWRRGVENYWLQLADQEQDFSVAQIKQLERAFQVEPQNAQTALLIGRDFRRQSQEGGQHYEDGIDKDYQQRAEQAMTWFQRSIKLDKWNAYSVLGYGWCLDWLGKTEESGAWFARAEGLDPNGYFTMAQIGLHYIECGKFAAARPWFERSLMLERVDNPIAKSYLQIANDRLLENATNDLNLRLSAPPQ